MGIGPSFACSGPPCVNRDPEQHRGVCSPSLSEGRLLWPCREPMHVVGSVRVWATLVPAFWEFAGCYLELCNIAEASQFDAASVTFVLQCFIQPGTPSCLRCVCS